ncbi:MAG: penicillin-binding transpeptidase domain-containing protein, partial [Flavisolibacter sp.]
PDEEPASLPKPQPYLIFTGLIGLGLLSLAATNAWWAIWRGPSILERTDNSRRSVSDRYVKRGSLLDNNEEPINITQGNPGDYIRTYAYPELAPVTGYTNPTYGQSGLEASLDLYLRGLQGNPASSIWWDHLVYGQPPPGLNIRLSLDLEIQKKADDLLGTHTGAIVLINASSGEILAMASHPTFDPSNLDEQATILFKDPTSPLLDRAAQGVYPPGNSLDPFFHAAGYPTMPPQSIADRIYISLGFFAPPELRLPVAEVSKPGSALRVSPLQMVLAAATLSNDGIRPAPRLAMAVDTPTQSWIILPALTNPVTTFSATNSSKTAQALMVKGQPIWQWNALVIQNPLEFTWSLGGTLPDYQGVPLAVVVLLEENDENTAGQIGRTLLELAANP